MATLSAFFAGAAKRPENQEVVISDRFVEDGKPVPWVIRAITEAENTSLKEACMTKKVIRGRQTATFDGTRYTLMLTAASIVYPDLKNAELQKSYGVMGETELLSAMLLPGEFADLAAKAQEISGFKPDDFEEAKDAVKNS